MFLLHVCTCTVCLLDAKETMILSYEQELWIVVSQHVGAESHIQPSGRVPSQMNYLYCLQLSYIEYNRSQLIF